MLIGILFCTVANAQAHLYNTTRTFREVGFTYQANVEHGRVTLFNAANRYVMDGRRATFRDGRPVPQEFLDDPTPWTSPNSIAIIPIVTTIVRNALTPAERQRMGDNPLFVTMFVNQTATTPQPVTEVFFEFRPSSPFATLPVSVYRRIELEIIRQVRMMSTERGRMLSRNGISIPIRVN